MTPTITEHEGLLVLRDDLLPGGSKRRFLTPILRTIPEHHLAYAGPSEGYAQLALGHTAKETGHEVHYFVAARTTDHPTRECRRQQARRAALAPRTARLSTDAGRIVRNTWPRPINDKDNQL